MCLDTFTTQGNCVESIHKSMDFKRCEILYFYAILAMVPFHRFLSIFLLEIDKSSLPACYLQSDIYFS